MGQRRLTGLFSKARILVAHTLFRPRVLLRVFTVALLFLTGLPGGEARADLLWSTTHTGAQTQIDIDHTSAWTLTPLADIPNVPGGLFTIKRGSQTTDTIQFTLYQGVDNTGTLLRQVTLQPGDVTQSFSEIVFAWAPPITLMTGISYHAAVTSVAPDVQSQAYFIK